MAAERPSPGTEGSEHGSWRGRRWRREREMEQERTCQGRWLRHAAPVTGPDKQPLRGNPSPRPLCRPRRLLLLSTSLSALPHPLMRDCRRPLSAQQRRTRRIRQPHRKRATQRGTALVMPVASWGHQATNHHARNMRSHLLSAPPSKPCRPTLQAGLTVSVTGVAQQVHPIGH